MSEPDAIPARQRRKCHPRGYVAGGVRVAGDAVDRGIASRGRAVVGAVSSCSSNGPVEIFQGQVEGRTVSFKCRSGDGARTLTLSGTIDGDAIAFTWVKHVIEGGFLRPDDVMFGDASPRTFKATRSSDTPKVVADLAAKASGPMAVSFRRVLEAAGEPRNWLSYSGNLSGHRHSALTRITPSNVKDLELVWLRQTPTRARLPGVWDVGRRDPQRLSRSHTRRYPSVPGVRG